MNLNYNLKNFYFNSNMISNKMKALRLGSNLNKFFYNKLVSSQFNFASKYNFN